MEINYEIKHEKWMDDLIWVTVDVKVDEAALAIRESLTELLFKAGFE